MVRLLGDLGQETPNSQFQGLTAGFDPRLDFFGASILVLVGHSYGCFSNNLTTQISHYVQSLY